MIGRVDSLQLAAVAFVAAVAVSGCARDTVLEPAPAANTLGEGRAIDEEAGVMVITETNDWPGNPNILAHVTPVRVTVRNGSDQPVRIQYRQFQLQGAGGQSFAALPPFKIEGNVRNPVVTSPYDPVLDAPGYRGFYLDPLYSDVWPTLDPFGSDLYDYDMGYYDRYHTYWRRPLPTPEMLGRALPEGVLEPGGELSGFLFFEKVTDVDRVQFTARLINPESGQVIGVARIPFRTRG